MGRKGRVRRVLLSIVIALLVLVAGAWIFRGQILSWLAARAVSRELTRAEAEADLAVVVRLLESRYSYLERTGFDYRPAVENLKGRLDGITVRQFAVELMKLIAPFGDGHARVRKRWIYLPIGYAAFHVRAVAGGRLVAMDPDHEAFVDADHPYLTHLDGVDVQRWVEAARAIVQHGSPQYVRRKCLEHLVYAKFLRRELGLPAGGAVRLRLESENRRSRTELERDLTSDVLVLFMPLSRHEEPATLAGGIGYLPIEGMDDRPEFLYGLMKAMEDFRKTRGLILDVRGNGGGTRHALRALFPYLMKGDDPPRVVNVAAYRLQAEDEAGDPRGFLSNRFMYPALHPDWSPEERAAIAGAAAAFEPEWRLPAGKFSAWHYLVLEPVAEQAGRRYYHYDRPVVVLLDAGCFSATDIFLSGFKGWRNVTLMGTPSSGGSGRSRSYGLENSRIKVRLSTMASFRADGRAIDGNGIQPDVIVEPVATDLIGRTDTVLEAALSRLR
ncbi:MAG: S41 family peptidase [Planctomycetota bacterium]